MPSDCPALAERGEIGDRGGEEGRLGIDGQVERLGRALPGEPADRLAERVVGFGEDGRGRRRRDGEGLSHPDGLGPLAGEHEGESTHKHVQRTAAPPCHATERVQHCTDIALVVPSDPWQTSPHHHAGRPLRSAQSDPRRRAG